MEELRAYKEKHGHLNVRSKDDKSLYDFCNNLRQARKGKGPYKLDETRIAALDAIGFNWDPLELKMSSTSPCAMTSKSTQQATNPKNMMLDTNFSRSSTLAGTMVPSLKFFKMLMMDGIVGASTKMVIVGISLLMN